MNYEIIWTRQSAFYFKGMCEKGQCWKCFFCGKEFFNLDSKGRDSHKCFASKNYRTKLKSAQAYRDKFAKNNRRFEMEIRSMLGVVE